MVFQVVCIRICNVFVLADFNFNHYANAHSDVMLLLTGGWDASGTVESSTFA